MVWRRRKDLSLGENFRYPVVDGPGIALMVFLPPFLAIMALPVFDMVVHITSENALNPINLLIIPFSLPLIASFTLTIGYVLIFLGRILASSASGQDDHPRFPIWDRLEILEELARWIWASMTGLAIGGLPAMVYWEHCGGIHGLTCRCSRSPRQRCDRLCPDGIDDVPVARLAGGGEPDHGDPFDRPDRQRVSGPLPDYDFDRLALTAWTMVLLHSPSLSLGLLGLWGCWVFTLYAAMMVVRLLRRPHYKNESRLAWFRTSKG